jgi:hypothetical protein
MREFACCSTRRLSDIEPFPVIDDSLDRGDALIVDLEGRKTETEKR